jgi:hypothetical protein
MKANPSDTVTEADKENVEKRVLPESKTIVVRPELYQRLVIGRAAMMLEWSDPNKRPEGSPSTPTFTDLIVYVFSRADHFAQLMSKIIRQHPELRPIIEQVTRQDNEEYKLVEPMLMVRGKPKSK